MEHDKTAPCFWFSAHGGRIAELVKYYKTVFGEYLEEGSIVPLRETPSGHTEMCEVRIFGRKYLLMDTEQEHQALNDSASIMINCDDQEEIDKYWDYFTAEGAESQCGWCVDRYGLRWQIIPTNFDELMKRPNAWNIMLEQKRIVIEEYLK